MRGEGVTSGAAILIKVGQEFSVWILSVQYLDRTES